MSDHNTPAFVGFAVVDEALQRANLVGIPVTPGTKKPAVKDWMKSALLSEAERKAKRLRFPHASSGVLAGTPLSTGNRFGFVDVDHPGLVAFVQKVLGPTPSAKVGAKGLTIFCQVESGFKSRKLKRRSDSAPCVEVFADTGMTVIPPSPHPSGGAYSWVGTPLTEVPHADLPNLSQEKFDIIHTVIGNQHAWEIAEGGAGVAGHQPMLSLTSSGIANLTDDLDWLADCLYALFDKDYQGNTREEALGMLASAKQKGLGGKRGGRGYDPQSIGPVPLGYTRDGNYALRDQVRSIIIVASAGQLGTRQFARDHR